MIYLPSVYENAQVTEKLVEAALADIFSIWSVLDHSNGVATRMALEEVFAEIITVYGSVVATQAADRFEQLRDISQVKGRYKAVLAGEPEKAMILAKLRAELDPLFRGDKADPQAALSNINRLADHLIKDQGRQTTDLNTKRDKKALGYARVPTGDFTCAWCLLYASRGPVYRSESTALYKSQGGKYHDFCNCQATPVFSPDTKIEGYDEDVLYDYYLKARERSGSGNINDITKELETMASNGEYDLSKME